ncbi:hypothetical protein C0991_006725, partial [Blastosporella zonata]
MENSTNAKRARKLSSRVTNADNVAEREISEHRVTVTAHAISSRPKPRPRNATLAPTSATTSSRDPQPPVDEISDSLDDSEEPVSKRRRAASSPTSVRSDANGSETEAADVVVTKLLKDKGKDVNEFFEASVLVQGKPRRACKPCSKKGPKVDFTAEISTLRRHIQSVHYAAYHQWAKANNFNSMLPKDVKARNQAKMTENEAQPTLDPHLRERPPPMKIVKYTDTAFSQAALQWLAITDQPLDALNHPKFQEMIHIASRAENGVQIPSIKQTRLAIMNLFSQNLIELKN